ncbi:MAG TPA: DNA-3-methyladenine glycosylase [Candidatus Limnocylindrales bacterium]|nr:DNA-3-methyladenine glycosylase [Candidatus Limnocylindrales bacterium]
MTDRRDARPPSAAPDVEPARTIPRATLEGDTVEAGRALLGARLVRDPVAGLERRVGRIVEVEAYVGVEDRASHARMGPTARNRVMFGPAGVAYVYLVYGMHHCLNVVTEHEGRPAALLIRALEPVAGIPAMRAAREAAAPSRRRAAGPVSHHRPVAQERLAAGPGLVAAAFGIDRTFTGLDLCDPASPLRLECRPDDEPEPVVVATPRIGIAFAGEPWVSRPWRLVAAGSPSLSGPRAR